MHRICSKQQLAKLIRGIATEAIEKDSKDVFGTLSNKGARSLAVRSVEKYLPEDEDNYDKLEIDLTPRKNYFYYKYEITKYARQGQLGIRKALELFHQMKSKDRQTPTVDHFSPLIYGCAKAGYTKKAFDIYEESIKYIGKPPKSVVTCLLNACAESPFPDYGLKRLDWFRTHLKVEYNYTMNQIQFHSAIKAYGKLGQPDKASEIVKEMIDSGITPDADTFNMLFIGCASDRKSGSLLALRVYKRMRMYGIRPNIMTYRLMLRCIRDCGMGDPSSIKLTLGELPALTSFDQKLKYKSLMGKKRPDKHRNDNFVWLPLFTDLGVNIEEAIKLKQKTHSERDVKLIEPPSHGSKEMQMAQCLPSITTYSEKSKSPMTPLPNLLSDDHLDLLYRIEAIHFEKLVDSVERIMLFGGPHGYLDNMVKDGCKPDDKTFSMLLSCIRMDKDSQLEYFRLSKDHCIKRDLVFYDLFLGHICRNFNDKFRLKRALVYIGEMHKDGLRPNISTFEALAFGCDTWKQAKQLIVDVEHCGFVVSETMILRLFDVASNKKDFKYLHQLMQISSDYNYRPRKRQVDILEDIRLDALDNILKYEKNLLTENQMPYWLKPAQIKAFDYFNKTLGTWLKSVELYEEDHPWEQFHVDSSTKRIGYSKFIRQFKALQEVKQEALEKGENFGNLMEKATKVREKAVHCQ